MGSPSQVRYLNIRHGEGVVADDPNWIERSRTLTKYDRPFVSRFRDRRKRYLTNTGDGTGYHFSDSLRTTRSPELVATRLPRKRSHVPAYYCNPMK
jgi:hypothetical protein